MQKVRIRWPNNELLGFISEGKLEDQTEITVSVQTDPENDPTEFEDLGFHHKNFWWETMGKIDIIKIEGDGDWFEINDHGTLVSIVPDDTVEIPDEIHYVN